MLRFYRDQYRSRVGKIFVESIVGVDKWAGIAWGFFAVGLACLTRPIQARLMSAWEGLPVWVVPVFVMASVVVLFVRGLLKENFENFQRLNQTLQAERSATQAERENRSALEAKWASLERRKQVIAALGHAALEGQILHDDEPTMERVEEWAFRVAVLIWVTLDAGEVRLFYNDYGASIDTLNADSEAKQAIRRRLLRLHELIPRIDSDSLTVTSDFNSREWIGHRPPHIKTTPQTQQVLSRIMEIRGDASRQRASRKVGPHQ